MSELAKEHCEACSTGAARVTDEAMQTLQQSIPDWEVIEVNSAKRLQRTFKFKNFVQALKFTNEVANLAEAENHHPAILLEYGKATVGWWTHKIDGLHKNDFIMAARTDAVYRGME
ncbi:MAG TPA: 4a-hydroxytetrahydrobiopterin dehydratase [Marinobacter sp.]|nr:4a-hydroxytetrahydrobiopterin dehydratase [Marinobacter sp.]